MKKLPKEDQYKFTKSKKGEISFPFKNINHHVFELIYPSKVPPNQDIQRLKWVL